MSKSKRTTSSKERLKKWKMNKQEEQNATLQKEQGQPQVREVPYWNPRDTISMLGIEFETLYNGIQDVNYSIQRLFAVSQAVMQRNILDGTIRVRFEKLVTKHTDTGEPYQDYEVMSDEEQAPHIENFEKLVASIKENQAKAAELTKDGDSEQSAQEPSAIVDALGQPTSSN